MRPSNSPLEHLAAFAIVLAAGIVSATSLSAYIARVRRNPTPSHFNRTEPKAEFVSPSTRGSAIK